MIEAPPERGVDAISSRRRFLCNLATSAIATLTSKEAVSALCAVGTSPAKLNQPIQLSEESLPIKFSKNTSYIEREYGTVTSSHQFLKMDNNIVFRLELTSILDKKITRDVLLIVFHTDGPNNDCIAATFTTNDERICLEQVLSKKAESHLPDAKTSATTNAGFRYEILAEGKKKVLQLYLGDLEDPILETEVPLDEDTNAQFDVYCEDLADNVIESLMFSDASVVTYAILPPSQNEPLLPASQDKMVHT
jgi:hypothetical protein